MSSPVRLTDGEVRVPLRVVKVGGSLLQYPALVPALRDWITSQSAGLTVTVWGGGPFADAVRDLASRFPLDDQETHWLAVRLLDTTARIGKLLLPEAQFCHQWEELIDTCGQRREGLIIFSPEQFLQCYEPGIPGSRLPCNWDVTSDSIAARMAVALRADELTVLKSADPPLPITAENLARAGYVDRFFPRAIATIPVVHVVNLRGGRSWELPQRRLEQR